MSDTSGAVGDTSLTIGIDIGGTKVSGGVVDSAGRILSRHLLATPAHTAAGIETIVAAIVAEARAAFDVTAVGIGVAGFVDETRSRIRFSPNIAFVDTPLRDAVAGLVGLPVIVENDANAAAWGEFRFGAGRGQSHLVCLTLGTGVGSGFVFDGKLYRGGFGIGAECGHVQIVPGDAGVPCGCGQSGCLEMYVSGRALVRRARAAVSADPAAGAALLTAAGGQVDAIEGPLVTTLAQAGDPLAVRVLAEVGAVLGQGLADIAASLDPTCFVIGGGVCAAGDLILGPAMETYAMSLTGREHRPLAEVVVAELGNDAGLIGAADLARQAQ